MYRNVHTYIEMRRGMARGCAAQGDGDGRGVRTAEACEFSNRQRTARFGSSDSTRRSAPTALVRRVRVASATRRVALEGAIGV
jgi:hypothetical protein